MQNLREYYDRGCSDVTNMLQALCLKCTLLVWQFLVLEKLSILSKNQTCVLEATIITA